MRCINCYQEIPDNSKFCPQCGAKQPVQKMEPVSQVNEDTTTVNEEPQTVQQEEATVNEEAQSVQPEKVEMSAEQSEEKTAADAQPQAENVPEDAEPQTEKVQADAEVQPEEAVQKEAQENLYGAPNTYQYGQGYQQPNQGNPQGYYQQNNYNGMQPKPVNWVPYLVLSILSTLCCCLPFGVVGIVFSAKINSSMAAGNLEEAQKNAKIARIWIIVSFVLGILTWVIYMMLILTGAVSGSAYYYY